MADDTDTTTPTEAPPDDIRSLLNNAFDEQATDTGTTTSDTSPKPADTASDTTQKPEPTEQRAAGERARGPDGKFIRTEAEDAADAATRAAAPQPEKPAAPVATPAAAATPADGKEPPTNWLEADKATFKSLAPPAQEFLLRRHAAMEADYTRKTQQVAELRRDYEPVAQMFAPYAQQLAARNLTPATMIQGWANVEKQLVEGNGVHVIRGLIDGYKIPVDQVAAALGIRGPATTAAADGQVPAPVPNQPINLPPEIVQRLTAHEQWIAQEQQRQQYMAQQQQHEAQSRVMTDIEQFSQATDSAGNLLHPHFKDVEADMARLVLAYRAGGTREPPLSELYEQAVWANPSTRTHFLQAQSAAAEAQRAQAEEKRRAEVRAKAEQSRRAGGSVTGSPGGPPQGQAPRRGNGSVRDDIAAAFEDLEA